MPHQERVVEERVQLEAKVRNLQAFIDADQGVYWSLPVEDQQLLAQQLSWMKGYLGVLDQRIARFPAE